MSFCNVCTGVLQYRHNPIIDDQSSPEEDTFGHHRSWQSLRNSIQAGCWICQDASSLLPATANSECNTDSSTNVARSSVESSTFQFVTTLSVTLGDDGTYGSIRVFDALSSDRFAATGVELMRSSDLDPELASIQHDLSVSKNTSSPSSMQMAKYWLDECCRNHESCTVGSWRGTWFPTRLLDLGQNASPTADVRLVVTAEESPDGPYATLSHCWGQRRFIQLTTLNFPAFRRCIVLDDMPKTFQDAVTVCRSLAIRYLWIDSLCILQDANNRLDWYHEAGLMHKVYSFSHCNISASDAVDGSWGLFRDRHPSTLFPKKVDICRKTGNGTFNTETYFAEDGSLWRANVTKSIVNKRGWVFQERILSPRILHFCHDQIFWECREVSACEKYPGGFPASFLRNANHKAYMQYDSLVAQAVCGDFDADDESFCYKMWKHMIYRYTATSLSKPSDKLVAMSGIAKALGALLKDTYVAGLWRKNLEEQLLWSVAGQSPPASRPSAYRAPSWSWASVDGSVMWIAEDCCDLDITARVQSVRIVHATEDITGQIEGGYMDLEGDLKPLHLLPTSSTSANMAWHEFREIIDISCDFDDDHADGLRTTTAEEQSSGSWLYFMAMVVTTQYIRALLLRPVEDQKGTFRRVGVMWHDAAIIPSHVESRAAIVQDLDEEVKATLPCLRYGGGRHVIRVI